MRFVLDRPRTGRLPWGVSNSEDDCLKPSRVRDLTNKQQQETRYDATVNSWDCCLPAWFYFCRLKRRRTNTRRAWQSTTAGNVHNGKAVWGLAQHNGWWRAGQRPNIARNALGQIGPNRTENFDKLTNAMLRFGYPGFEHNFGLWYDRRRDAHDQKRRNDDKVVGPFLEQPWARSGQGMAWNGLSKYDLTQYNDWYFQRLKQFADLCDQKGTILLHNHYMQHALWRRMPTMLTFPGVPANCIQNTDLPDRNPAANAFYDVFTPAPSQAAPGVHSQMLGRARREQERRLSLQRRVHRAA